MEDLNLKQLMEKLGTPEKPVVSKEMTDFWKSLSDKEKQELKTAHYLV